MKRILVDKIHSFKYETSKLSVVAVHRMLLEAEKELMTDRRASHVRLNFMMVAHDGECEFEMRYKAPERKKEKLARLDEERSASNISKSVSKRSRR